MDFKLGTYKQLLLALQQANYTFHTFQDWCEGKARGRYVILRHDIDKFPHNALIIAQIEKELNIRASYYFQSGQKIYNPDVIKQIHTLGHEIGYHYNDLVDAKGDNEQAIAFFQSNLSQFRTIVPIKTIAMHGSPTSKYDNRELWRSYNYKNYDLLGEPYFDLLKQKDVFYFTDTARMWDGDKFNVRDKTEFFDSSNASKLKIHSTFDFIDWLGMTPNADILMITTHPQRWTDNNWQWVSELFTQNIKNVVKRLIVKFS
jgi:hypothetical protein